MADNLLFMKDHSNGSNGDGDGDGIDGTNGNEV